MSISIRQTGEKWENFTQKQQNEILLLLEQNPIAGIEEAEIINSEKWTKFNRNDVLTILAKTGERVVAVKADKYNFSGSIFCYHEETLIKLSFSDRYWKENSLSSNFLD